jgi:hypothetical protein
MTDTITCQNIYLSSCITLYMQFTKGKRVDMVGGSLKKRTSTNEPRVDGT